MASVARAAILAREAATDSRFLDVGQLCRVADTVAYAAATHRIRPERLLAASDRLMRCDPDKVQEAADEIRLAAVDVAEEAQAAELQLLQLAALDLERAAREFSESATDVKKFGWNWPWVSSCKKKKGKGKGKGRDQSGLMDVLLADSTSSSYTCGSPESQPVPMVEEGNLGEYLGYALFGSLALLPYTGPEGLTKGWSETHRSVFHLVFIIWWSIVAFGAVCRKCRHRFPLFCADFADLVGMIGITTLVILYSQSLLAPTSTPCSYIILIAAIIVQIFFWGWGCCSRYGSHRVDQPEV